MSELVPAWKRIGLKVKEELESDPLSLTAHLDTADVSAKQAKKLQKRARSADSKDNNEKKPPKRQKLPKSERAPPPEKDQLVYLRQFTDDRDNWKFSKQKQNWILKHVKVIEDSYEQYLVNYFEELQGGGKERMVRVLKGVVESWNKLQDETQKKEQEQLATGDDKQAKEKTEEHKDSKKPQEENGDLTRVDADFALRAKKLLAVMVDEQFILRGIDDVEKLTEADKSEKNQSKSEINISKPEGFLSFSKSDMNSGSHDSIEDEKEELGQSNGTTISPKNSQEASETDVSQVNEDKKPKGKKTKRYSNLSIEQVESTEWISSQDYVDGPLEDTEEVQEDHEKKMKKKKSKKDKKKKLSQEE